MSPTAELVTGGPVRTLRAALAAAKDALERQMITEALGRTEGNRTQAAKQLGVSVRTLQLRLAVYRRHAA